MANGENNKQAEKPAKAAKADKATVTLYAPANAGPTVSHGGEVYEADDKGTVEVPPHAVDDLRDHGWSTEPPAKAGK